jgi:hypothetical protein
MKHLSTHPIKRLVPPIILALLVLLLVGTIALAAPLQQGTINKYYIASVMDTSIKVSWTTELPVTAQINYGTTPALGSTVNDTQNLTTHYVSLEPLAGGTTYYYDVVSGATVDNNGGAHYTVAAAPNIGASSPTRLTWGYVRESNGTTAVPYAIVYYKVTHLGVDSQLVAVRTNASGAWQYNFGSLRTADLSAYFSPVNGDTITVIGQGGVLGDGTAVTTLSGSGTFQLPDIILDATPNAITLRSLTSRADASVWVPLVGLTLLGTAAIIIVRRRRG